MVLGEAEAYGGEFGFDLGAGEFHGERRAEGHFALVEVYVNDAAAGLQSLDELGVVGGAVFDVVENVADEDDVDGVGGEAGIVGRGEDGGDVGGGVFADDVEEFLVDVDRVDFGGVGGEAAGEVAGAGAKVGDGFGGFEVEGGDDLIGLLPGIAGGVFEDLGPFAG